MRATCLLIVLLAAACDGAAMSSTGDGGGPDGGVGLAVLGNGTHSAASVELVEIVSPTAALAVPATSRSTPARTTSSG